MAKIMLKSIIDLYGFFLNKEFIRNDLHISPLTNAAHIGTTFDMMPTGVRLYGFFPKDVKNPIITKHRRWNTAKIKASDITVSLSRISPENIAEGNIFIVMPNAIHNTILRKLRKR